MKKHTLLAVAAIALVMNTGCDMFQKSSGTTMNKDAYLPTDREQLLSGQESKSYSPQELEKGIVRGDWAIETVNGKPVVGEEAPFLKFVPSEKKIYGNNGCNVLNGTYTYSQKDTTMSFDNLATTMRLCASAGITDLEINQALSRVKHYRWALRDSQYWLYLLDNQKHEVMSLMHQNFEFLNGTWRVAAVAGEPVNDPLVKLVIDIDEGKIHGYTGCNTINGSVEIDMQGINSISFQAFTRTKKGCPEGSIETQLLVALENGDHAQLVSPTTVYIVDSAGSICLVLEKERS